MALNFELVVSDQLFSVFLVADNGFKIQRYLPSCGVNVTSKLCVPKVCMKTNECDIDVIFRVQMQLNKDL